LLPEHTLRMTGEEEAPGKEKGVQALKKALTDIDGR
jgi:hypothetical protein